MTSEKVETLIATLILMGAKKVDSINKESIDILTFKNPYICIRMNTLSDHVDDITVKVTTLIPKKIHQFESYTFEYSDSVIERVSQLRLENASES